MVTESILCSLWYNKVTVQVSSLKSGIESIEISREKSMLYFDNFAVNFSMMVAICDYHYTKE